VSDPLRALVTTQASSSPVPIADIRSRAAAIERRRHVVLGSGAAVIAIIGLTMLFAGARPGLIGAPQQIARGTSLVPTPAFLEHTAEPTAEGEATSAEKRLAQPALPEPDSRRIDMSGDAPQSNENSAAAATPTQRATAGALDVDLDVNDESLGPARRIGFTLTACNKTDAPIERTFTSGQRYDFEVKRDGEDVWRWSDGQAFTQIYGYERWEAGECKTFSDSWNGRNPDGSRAESGQYEAIGTLTSDPPIRSDPETFCVDTC
jgi:hypothetical protein